MWKGQYMAAVFFSSSSLCHLAFFFLDRSMTSFEKNLKRKQERRKNVSLILQTTQPFNKPLVRLASNRRFATLIRATAPIKIAFNSDFITYRKVLLISVRESKYRKTYNS